MAEVDRAVSFVLLGGDAGLEWGEATCISFEYSEMKELKQMGKLGMKESNRLYEGMKEEGKGKD